jgi:hypothetical protein
VPVRHSEAPIQSPCVSFRPAQFATVTLTPQWRYVDATESAEAMAGVPLIGACIWDLFPQYRETPLGALMYEVMASRAAGDVRMAAPQTPDSDVVASVTPVEDGNILVAFRLAPRRTRPVAVA